MELFICGLYGRQLVLSDRELFVKAGKMDANDEHCLVNFGHLEDAVDGVYRQGFFLQGDLNDAVA